MSPNWNNGSNQWGGTGFGYATTARPINQAAFNEGLRQHMLRVYNYMAAGVAITGLVAYLMFSSGLAFALAMNKGLYIAVCFAPMLFSFIFPQVPRMSVAGAQMTFWAYAALFGVAFSPIFLRFTGGSIASVFFISASTFLAASLYGYTTRADLTKMGGFLAMGAFGIMIAIVANIFLQSSVLHMAISVLGVLIFTGLTAFDTQEIKQTYSEAYGHETNQKVAVISAVNLYGNFVMIFQFLLSLLGDRE